MKILLITICYNEEKMLPHFLKYYSQYCDKMIFCDGGSTDKSHELIKANPKCELNLDYVADKADDIMFLEIKNNLWKNYREEYDWCIIVDIDEFLYFPEGLIKLFKNCDKNKATVVYPKGYDMYSVSPVESYTDLFKDVTKGIPFDNSSKMCAFNIKKLKDINYLAGCHIASPIEMEEIPALTFSSPDNLKLLHYRYLGLGDILKKKHIAYERLSERNKQNGFGIHNTWTDDLWIHSFSENLKNSKEVI